MKRSLIATLVIGVAVAIVVGILHATKAIAGFEAGVARLVSDYAGATRVVGEKSFFPRIAGATGLQVSWPALRNVGVYQGGTGRWNAALFVDPSKAPNKKA